MADLDLDELERLAKDAKASAFALCDYYVGPTTVLSLISELRFARAALARAREEAIEEAIGVVQRREAATTDALSLHDLAEVRLTLRALATKKGEGNG